MVAKRYTQLRAVLGKKLPIPMRHGSKNLLRSRSLKSQTVQATPHPNTHIVEESGVTSSGKIVQLFTDMQLNGWTVEKWLLSNYNRGHHTLVIDHKSVLYIWIYQLLVGLARSFLSSFPPLLIPIYISKKMRPRGGSNRLHRLLFARQN